MKTVAKKLAALALAAMMTVTGAASVFAATDSPAAAPKAETQKTVKASVAGVKGSVVDTDEKGTAVLKKLAKTTKKSVSVGDTVTVNGVKYKVTTVAANAFKNAAKVKTITLGKNVYKFNNNAFKGAKSLKTLKIKATKKAVVSSKAFKGLDTKKMTIKITKKMSAKNYKATVKALKKAGFKGKVARF